MNKLPYDSDRAKQAALQVRPGPGVIVPGRGVRDANITHVCPECGGRFALNQLEVQRCWACFGKGEMSNAELTAYETRLQERAHEQERRNGTR